MVECVLQGSFIYSLMQQPFIKHRWRKQSFKRNSSVAIWSCSESWYKWSKAKLIFTSSGCPVLIIPFQHRTINHKAQEGSWCYICCSWCDDVLTLEGFLHRLPNFDLQQARQKMKPFVPTFFSMCYTTIILLETRHDETISG